MAGGLTDRGARLDVLLRATILGDAAWLLGATLTGGLWVRSSWFVALWLIRAALIVLTVWCRRSVRVRRQRALGMLFGAHLTAAVATVAVLPEAAPLVALVLIGDLVTMATFGTADALHRSILAGAGAAALVGLLSFQSWTGLATRVPRGLLAAVLVGHIVGTAAVIANGARAGQRSLVAQLDGTAAAQRRRRDAAVAQRAAIAEAIANGPGAALHATGECLHRTAALLAGDERSAAAAEAHRGAVTCERALGSLRELSHGIFPEVLHHRGLRDALRALAATNAQLAEASVPDIRLEADHERAVYFTVLEVLGTLAPSARLYVRSTTTVAGTIVELKVTADEPGDTGAALGDAHLADRLGAVAIEVGIEHGKGIDRRRAWSLRAHLPISGSPDGAAPAAAAPAAGRVRGRAGRSGRAAGLDEPLRRFVLASVALCSAGIVFLAVVVAVTGIASLTLLACALIVADVLLMFAEAARRRGQLRRAAALVAVETFYAGLAVTALLPSFLPVTLVITLLPLTLALAHLRSRATRTLAGAQTVGAALVATIGYLGGAPGLVDPVPRQLEIATLPTALGAITALVAVTMAATQQQLRTSAAAWQRSLAEVVRDADSERARIERDLHDGAQQHLVALALQLRVAATLAEHDRPRAQELTAALADHAVLALAEIDQLVGGMRTVDSLDVLRQRLEQLAERATPPFHLAVDAAPEDLDRAARASVTAALEAAYFCCVEALQNAAKHAGPDATVIVSVGVAERRLRIEVRDDGAGFELAGGDGVEAPGRGLRNLRDRCRQLGGTMQLTTAPGCGTTLTASFPLEAATTGRPAGG